MIKVPRPAREPDDFDTEVRQKGNTWLKNNPTAKTRPPPHWGECLGHIQKVFGGRCGYLAIHTLGGTVDHFVSINEDRSLAYEWTNYRYVEGWVNSSKKDIRDVLDPFEVEDDWFELVLPSLQLKLTSKVPMHIRSIAEWTIKRLKLDHGERVIRTRRYWLEQYEKGIVNVDSLEEFAPMIARAIRKNPNYLDPSP